MTFIVRYCDNCTTNEVCLADEILSENIPTCRKIKDITDPTGCGGLCEHGKQICHRLGHGAYRYSYFECCLKNSRWSRKAKWLNLLSYLFFVYFDRCCNMEHNSNEMTLNSVQGHLHPPTNSAMHLNQSNGEMQKVTKVFMHDRTM